MMTRAVVVVLAALWVAGCHSGEVDCGNIQICSPVLSSSSDSCSVFECPSDDFACNIDSDCVAVDAACCSDDSISSMLVISRTAYPAVDELRHSRCLNLVDGGRPSPTFDDIESCNRGCAATCLAQGAPACVSGKCAWQSSVRYDDCAAQCRNGNGGLADSGS